MKLVKFKEVNLGDSFFDSLKKTMTVLKNGLKRKVKIMHTYKRKKTDRCKLSFT